MSVEFSDPRDILLLSAALQVYHETGIVFADEAVAEHEEMFSEEMLEELEQRLIDMTNMVNGEARVLFDGINSAVEMREEWRPYAVWGAHTVTRSKQFREFVMGMMGAMFRDFQARNN